MSDWFDRFIAWVVGHADLTDTLVKIGYPDQPIRGRWVMIGLPEASLTPEQFLGVGVDPSESYSTVWTIQLRFGSGRTADPLSAWKSAMRVVERLVESTPRDAVGADSWIQATDLSVDEDYSDEQFGLILLLELDIYVPAGFQPEGKKIK